MMVRTFLILAFSMAVALGADETLFRDDFKGPLAEGWKWVREDPKGWRLTEHGLEIRSVPGNMWGGRNDAKNVLIRPLPDRTHGTLEISVRVGNQPTEQYEQVDLVCYFDDSHMVKIGQEQVDGKLCVVMGREEKDRTRTIAIIPKATISVRLRLLIQGSRISGFYSTGDRVDWKKAGECDLPGQGKAHASLQVYQGPAETERWASISEFRIRRLGE